MEARINNPALILSGAFEALQKLSAAGANTGIPKTTHYLMHVRASQINGCSVCLDMHSRELRHAGEGDARIFTIAAWREAPYFSDAERAALEAARYYNEQQLATLLLSIATINTWNRLMVASKQISGEWVEQVIQRA